MNKEQIAREIKQFNDSHRYPHQAFDRANFRIGLERQADEEWPKVVPPEPKR